MASLEGGTGAVAVASGSGRRVHHDHEPLLAPGDEIVAFVPALRGTMTLFGHTLKKLSIPVKCRRSLVITPRVGSRDGHLKPRCCSLRRSGSFGRDPDLEALGSLARAKGVPLIADNTFCRRPTCADRSSGARDHRCSLRHQIHRRPWHEHRRCRRRFG